MKIEISQIAYENKSGRAQESSPEIFSNSIYSSHVIACRTLIVY